MIKLNLLILWSIALVVSGAIGGWKSHEKLVSLQSRPWEIVQLFGVGK